MTETKYDLNKLSGLLRAAVDDVQLAVSNGFRLDMCTYWYRGDGTYCTVCMAGAMLAEGRFVDSGFPGLPVSKDFQELPLEIRRRMAAVDSLRVGNIADAADELGITGHSDEVLDGIGEYLRGEVPPFTGIAPFEKYIETAEALESMGL